MLKLVQFCGNCGTPEWTRRQSLLLLLIMVSLICNLEKRYNCVELAVPHIASHSITKVKCLGPMESWERYVQLV